MEKFYALFIKYFPTLVVLLFVFLGYLSSAQLGLHFEPIGGFASLIWPASGVGLAMVLLIGRKVWPAIFLGAFAVNLAHGAPWISALGMATGNTLEALVGAFLLTTVARVDLRFVRARDGISFILLGPFLSTLVAATIGAVSLSYANIPSFDFGLTWLAWWLGDMLGELLVTPFLTVWYFAIRDFVRERKAQKLRWRLRVEVLLILLVNVAVTGAIFNGLLRNELSLSLYLLFPALLWNNIRLRQKGGTLVVLLISAYVIFWAYRGMGIFASSDLISILFELQIFLTVLSACSLLISASIEQSRIAFLKSQEEEEDQAFLAQASSLLVTFPNSEKTLRSVVQLIVPKRADWAIFDLYDDDSQPRVSAFAHKDPAKEPLLAALQAKRSSHDWHSQILHQIRYGQSLWMPFITDSILKSKVLNEEHFNILKELGTASAIKVPLRTRKKIYGSLIVVRSKAAHPLRDRDLQVIEQLAKNAAYTLDNAYHYERAQQAINLRDEFLSIASHELKTPLTSLYLQLQLLVKTLDISQKSQSRLVSCEWQAHRLAMLIDELLDLTRIRQGKFAIHTQKTSLNKVVQDVVNRYAQEALRAGTSISLDFGDEVVGQWDPVRLEQIVTNLLSNAIKYGNQKPITICTRKEGEHAVFQVQDQGVGVGASEQAKIFNRFERLHLDRKVGGLGLGLYIVKQIVDAHGGTVELNSEIGKGSTFTVRLPMVFSVGLSQNRDLDLKVNRGA